MSDDTYHRVIGEVLQGARKESGLTQMQLAVRLDTSVNTISENELGKRGNASWITTYERELHYPLGELYGRVCDRLRASATAGGTTARYVRPGSDQGIHPMALLLDRQPTPTLADEPLALG